LAAKTTFGRTLPKIKVGTISAKNKSWQTQSFFLLFARTHCHSLCIRRAHKKNTPKASHSSQLTYTSDTTHTTPHHT
jgi:hypothetical protein